MRFLFVLLSIIKGVSRKSVQCRAGVILILKCGLLIDQFVHYNANAVLGLKSKMCYSGKGAETCGSLLVYFRWTGVSDISDVLLGYMHY